MLLKLISPVAFYFFKTWLLGIKLPTWLECVAGWCGDRTSVLEGASDVIESNGYLFHARKQTQRGTEACPKPHHVWGPGSETRALLPGPSWFGDSWCATWRGRQVGAHRQPSAAEDARRDLGGSPRPLRAVFAHLLCWPHTQTSAGQEILVDNQ